MEDTELHLLCCLHHSLFSLFQWITCLPNSVPLLSVLFLLNTVGTLQQIAAPYVRPAALPCLVPVFEIPHLSLSWFTLSFYRPDPRKLTKGCMGNCYWDFFYVLECLWSLLSFTNRIQDWKSFSFRFSKLSSSFLQPLLRRSCSFILTFSLTLGGGIFLYSFDNYFSVLSEMFFSCML